ncbi:hypothetical protein G6L29_10590 [Agrobacterium rhizogenes]|uniref:hypothetical protein n=1 Tax=Rhizobium rhizogenes TaxID=359 RepID=UPI0015749724|nr:hypothetical protein [Rhizobium rhizogenes]NTI16083.1 hypothetical protein [Rhizobium rhizogenes]
MIIADLVKEIVSGLLRMRDVRNRKRTERFLSGIEPYMALMREAHQDFLVIASSLQELCKRAALIVEDHSTDSSPQLKELIVELRALSDLREKRRASRRELYESVIAHLAYNHDNATQEVILFSEDEAQAMENFYRAIKIYFEVKQGIYGHEIERYISQTGAYISALSKNERERYFLEQLGSIAETVARQETRFEDDWARISRQFARVKIELGSTVTNA